MTTKEARKIIIEHFMVFASLPEEVVQAVQTLAEASEEYEQLQREKRKIGHWIETAEEYYKAENEKGGGVNEDTDFFTDDIACSECLAKFSVIDNEAERFDFCPCCGSDNK